MYFPSVELSYYKISESVCFCSVVMANEDISLFDEMCENDEKPSNTLDDISVFHTDR